MPTSPRELQYLDFSFILNRLARRFRADVGIGPYGLFKVVHEMFTRAIIVNSRPPVGQKGQCHEAQYVDHRQFAGIL